VVRRPGGLIATALQYGHVRTRVTLAYAGEADTGWLDDVLIEHLEMVIDQTTEDRGRLDGGEHVSGPSAPEYRRRLARAAPFVGRTVNQVRNAERLLRSNDPNIHHGQGMTCVFRAETAQCRRTQPAAGAGGDRPDQSDCRSTCANLAYTDRDITDLRQRLSALQARANDPLAPAPLRDRATAQADQTRAVINGHERAEPPTGRGPGGIP